MELRISQTGSHFIFRCLGTKWRADTAPKTFSHRTKRLFSVSRENNTQCAIVQVKKVERPDKLQLLEVPCERIPGQLPTLLLLGVALL